jgi:ankyrin repeat protein
VFCQLETLRYCLPPSVRRTLSKLPESLDETYERVLKEIKKPNRDLTLRLLQCLVAAIRPLGVKELAEVLAVDFNDAEGIPNLKPNWRWEDQEQALLTSCSSLIAIVGTGRSRVVQFSHFSVKEFLTSERLATSSGDVSRYHIVLEPAHTILAQVCMSVLLQPDNRVERNGVGKSSPLAGYAARHWVTHAQFESVSSFLRKAMEYLFDLDMPYFRAWLQLHDIDTRPGLQSSPLHWFAVSSRFRTTPLYYASLCGFEGLVEHLVIRYPQHVNAGGGYYVTPLVAALAGRHFQTVKFLRHNGAHVNVRGNNGETPLFSAVWYGDLEMVQVLLDHGVDVNALSDNKWTPIHYVSQGSRLPATPHNIPQLFPDVARLLLEHGADVNAPINRGSTPLHVAADFGRVEVVRVLLEHGANVGAEDHKGRTPLRVVVDNGRVEIVRVLLEHGANAGEEDHKGRTPLHAAAVHGRVEVARALLEHGARVDAEDYKGRTPLHAAAVNRMVEVVRVLLEHGANEGEDKTGRTPFRIASAKGDNEIMTLLLEHGAEGVL